MSTSGETVWCVLCVGHDESYRVHIFSSAEKRQAWVDAQPDDAERVYVHYDYVIDDPDGMDKPPRKAQ